MSNPKFRAAADDLEDALDDGEDAVEETVARLRDETAALADEMPNLPEEIRAALEDLEDRIAELYDVVSEQAAASVETVEEIIQTRPWASVAVAFGAGCLLTLLVSGSRRAPSPRRWW